MTDVTQKVFEIDHQEARRVASEKAGDVLNNSYPKESHGTKPALDLWLKTFWNEFKARVSSK